MKENSVSEPMRVTVLSGATSSAREFEPVRIMFGARNSPFTFAWLFAFVARSITVTLLNASVMVARSKSAEKAGTVSVSAHSANNGEKRCRIIKIKERELKGLRRDFRGVNRGYLQMQIKSG